MARGRPDVAATRHQLQKRGTRVSNLRAVISRATGELADIGRETKDVGKRQMRVEQIRGKEQTRRRGEIGTVEIDIELIGVDCRIRGGLFSGVELYERFRENAFARERVVDLRVRGVDGARRRVDVERDGVVHVYSEFDFKERKIVRLRGRGGGVLVSMSKVCEPF
jgi:hypothetical protein